MLLEIAAPPTSAVGALGRLIGRGLGRGLAEESAEPDDWPTLEGNEDMLDGSVHLEAPGSTGSRLGIEEKSDIRDASVGFGWALRCSAPLKEPICVNKYGSRGS